MSMTVAQLRAQLADLPDDMPVVMAADAEGNSHSPLECAEQAMYVAETTWSGDVYCTNEELAQKMAEPNSPWTADDAAPDDAVRVLLLGPVN
jgi:hypothetical protein